MDDDEEVIPIINNGGREGQKIKPSESMDEHVKVKGGEDDDEDIGEQDDGSGHVSSLACGYVCVVSYHHDINFVSFFAFSLHYIIFATRT